MVRSKRKNRFNGIKDLKPYFEGYAIAKYRIDPIVISIGLYHSLNKPSIGGFIRTGFSYFMKFSEKLNIFFGPSTKISNENHMQTLYGITAAESSTSGKPIYNMHLGVEDFRFNLGLNYQINKPWNFHIMFSVKRVFDHAANSPIIENRIQYFGNITINYKF